MDKNYCFKIVITIIELALHHMTIAESNMSETVNHNFLKFYNTVEDYNIRRGIR